MNAETRLAVVLFGSFVLWFPTLSSVLRGELDAEAAGIRWAVGAALVWVMLTALNQLVVGYAVDSPGDEPRRRADDTRAESGRSGPAFPADDDGEDAEAHEETGSGDPVDAGADGSIGDATPPR